MTASRLMLVVCLTCAGIAASAVARPAREEKRLPAAGAYAVTAEVLALAGDDVAVVRLDALEFDVSSRSRATRRVRQAVTVLKPGGRDHGTVTVWYDRQWRLASLEGRLFDADGREVRKLKKSEVMDYSAVADFSLFDDTRVRVAELYHDAYPYTVEWEYAIEHHGMVTWPEWYPQTQGLAVERAWYELRAPSDLPVRHAVRGTSIEPSVTGEDGRQVFRWEARDLPAFEREPYGPPIGEQMSVVYTAPVDFEIESFWGRMQTWTELGDWYYTLSRDRRVLPEAVVAEARALTSNATSIREKTRILYEYLQRRTRYISIQLGIGGWQPMEAAYVHERGYGDCKALTNYMGALLAAVDVDSYPALIRSGVNQPSLLPDFPNNYFNHVILAVPTDEDTLWLETTSQTIPFGHIGAGNESRHALMVAPGASSLVRTPGGDPAQNLLIRTGTIALTAAGHATAELRMRYTGNQQDAVRQALVYLSPKDREDWLREALALPVGDGLRVDFSAIDSGDREIELPVTASLNRQAVSSGSRLFFRPGFLDQPPSVPPEVADRVQPVRTSSYAYRDVDSLRFTLPPGFRVEALPNPANVETDFGTFQSAIEPDDAGALTYRRFLEVRKTTLPPESYEKFRSFFRQIATADAAQVVLVRE